LGLWQGSYGGINRLWLRWYDCEQHWIPTPVESEQKRTEQEKQRTEQEKQRAELAEAEIARLRALLEKAGINANPDLNP
jgi:hypothetical protein